MSSDSRVKILLEGQNNFLRILFSGAVRYDDIAAQIPALAEALKSLQPGFSLVTDLTEVDSMDAGCVPAIKKTMDMLRDRGVQRIVRIIPDTSKDIGMNILSLFHYPRGVKIMTVETRAEAQNALA